MTTDPVLPYSTGENANSGFAAGVATSEERARRDDHDGTTSERQAKVLWALATESPGGSWNVGQYYGITWKELADLCAWHHGQASGVLSVLHKAGKVARLVERRNRCHVYVLPEYVNGRDTQEQGRPRTSADAVTVALIHAEATIVAIENILTDCEFYVGSKTCVTQARVGGENWYCWPCRIRAIIGRD